MKAKKLRELLKEDKLYVLPGVSNAFLATLVENAGYEIVYLSGAGMVNMNWCLPDYNMISMSENLEIARRVNDAVQAPIICDIDNGYGGYINVYRTLREYSKAGIAGVQLEDQQNPKRCGHFEDHAIIPAEEMVGKIKAARDGSINGDTVIMARTDAISATGSFDAAVERMDRYIEAGADVVFIEAVRTVEDMKKIPPHFSVPTLINLVEKGKTPVLTNAEYEKMGFKLALYACQSLKATAFGVNKFLEFLKANDTTNGADDVCMITSDERHIITHKDKYKDLISSYEKIYKTR